jgi:hypothetical protein
MFVLHLIVISLSFIGSTLNQRHIDVSVDAIIVNVTVIHPTTALVHAVERAVVFNVHLEFLEAVVVVANLNRLSSGSSPAQQDASQVVIIIIIIIMTNRLPSSVLELSSLPILLMSNQLFSVKLALNPRNSILL